MHITIKKNYLICGEYKVKCAVGKRGIKKKIKEGDLITPKGSFKIKDIYYRKDKVKNLYSKLRKTIIHKNMGWCDDPKSKEYNKLIKYPFKYSSEKLFRSDNLYDIIIVLDFNMHPIKKNKGSAIFIHVASKNLTPTKGCVAVRKKELIKITNFLTKKTKIKIS